MYHLAVQAADGSRQSPMLQQLIWTPASTAASAETRVAQH
jgi:hypothetical protein